MKLKNIKRQKKKAKAEADGIESLIERLERSGRYKTIEKHVIWQNKGHGGEYDVLATTHKGTRVYWEWKNRYSSSGYNTAKKQAQRSYDFARGGKKMMYAMATPTRVKRLRPYKRRK